ncbi:MAG: hypothetical protein OER56_01735 [Hyphomicrobiales bacterium]|nr:hypothetical protein [Hyphomicrobiales bacterium]
METFADVMAKWPTITDFAADLKIKPVTAYAMLYRNRISQEHWVRLVNAARKRRISGVTYKALAEMAAREPIQAAE